MGVTSPRMRRIARAMIARLAVGAPVRVFVIRGVNPPGDPALLRLYQGVVVLDSPRSATVLLIAGTVPDALHEAVRHAHDEMAHPRGTVRWASASGDARALHPGRDDINISSPDIPSLLDILARLQHDLLDGKRLSETDLLPATSRAAWRDVGPYGQGGSGMTGGVPYGRPLAERAPDRDSLELDQLPLRIGPYFSPFPAGLILDVQLQGDVVQEVALSAEPSTPLPPPFSLALREPVPVAAVERARAQEHLRWLAHGLRVHGLAAIGVRALRLAAQIAACEITLADSAAQLLAVTRDVHRSGVLRSTRGVGLLGRNDVESAGIGLGPVARASGVMDDARSEEPAYRALGFKPVVSAESLTQGGGDACARWRQRLAEARQSIELAQSAGDTCAWGRGFVEGPRGRATAAHAPESKLYAILPEILQGLEWGEAVTTIVSLDLGEGGDVREVGHWAAAEKIVQSAEDAMKKAAASSGSGMAGMAGMPHMGH